MTMFIKLAFDPILACLTVVIAVATNITWVEALNRLLLLGPTGRTRWRLFTALVMAIGLIGCLITGMQALVGQGPYAGFSLETYAISYVAAGALASFALGFGVIRLIERLPATYGRPLIAAAAVVAVCTICQFTLLAALRDPVMISISWTALILPKVVELASFALGFRLFFEDVDPRNLSLRRRLAALLFGGSFAFSTLALLRACAFVDVPTSGHVLGEITLRLTDLGGAAVAFVTMVIMFASLLGAYEQSFNDRQTALDADIRRLKEVEQVKTDLLNTVSHELRTPLMSILGYAEFLEDELAGPLTPGQREYLQRILEGVDRLQGLVNDLLDLARIEAGTLRLSRRDIDLAFVVGSAVESLEPQAFSAQVRLETRLPESAVTVYIDPARIGQVVLNLVGNAIKFTPVGGYVRVSLELHQDRAVVSVSDSGVGIAEEHVEKLFRRFYQVDSGSTREHGGAGLGLAISKAIVAAQGGAVGVISKLNEGSTFYFELPLGGSPRPQPETQLMKP